MGLVTFSDKASLSSDVSPQVSVVNVSHFHSDLYSCDVVCCGHCSYSTYFPSSAYCLHYLLLFLLSCHIAYFIVDVNSSVELVLTFNWW